MTCCGAYCVGVCDCLDEPELEQVCLPVATPEEVKAANARFDAMMRARKEAEK